MRKNIAEQLSEFFGGEIAGYIVDAGKTYLKIRLESWEGERVEKITLKDVVEYYATQANNISSGARKIGKVIGDWRNIDALAKLCLDWFKFVNIDELRRESKKWGLIPKF